ncbi:seminase-like [Scaptodrosophila lebanonensis]|uniref:trypsin n=1 Tax=Drosophila lebanonensis TaxID=7225 RepID=A0A6J2TLE5_DROLE|nr:seminase-like [Scaptodrosophila lebanonensis]
MAWRLMSLLLALQLSGHSGKVYKSRITIFTERQDREWQGVNSNTGDNHGGWLVRIMNGNGFFACGGAYYAPLMVLTSGTCIHDYRYALDGASADTPAVADHETENFSLLDTVHTPDDFRHTENFMDIAVVQLGAPIRGVLTEFIKLCTKPTKVGMNMSSYAWGYGNLDVQLPTINPKKTYVPVEDLGECQKKFWELRRKPTATSLCVTQPKDKMKCRYDPGAPLTWRNELCGVVSRGSRCWNTSYPGIYTDIYKVRKFIEDIEEGIENGDIKKKGNLK